MNKIFFQNLRMRIETVLIQILLICAISFSSFINCGKENDDLIVFNPTNKKLGALFKISKKKSTIILGIPHGRKKRTTNDFLEPNSEFGNLYR